MVLTAFTIHLFRVENISVTSVPPIPTCTICIRSPKVFNTLRSKISYKFWKMSKNFKAIKQNSRMEQYNH